VTLVDASRLVRFPGRPAQPRALVTIIRYPATGRPGDAELAGAAPARAAGPFPLVIFGHGFAVTPEPYARLLRAWAQAGYVVAAPIFPLQNGNAPGGPNEADLINQPRDMSFVISRLEMAGATSTGFLDGLIAGRAVAVTGQSDGGETALAAAYDRSFLDRRIRAAVILSGAMIPGLRGFAFPAPSPPLLATQGTADAINPPRLTNAFFTIAPRPKYLLTLFGAAHLDPYTNAQPQLGIVERVSLAFLDRYLKGDRSGPPRMVAAGNRAGAAELTAQP
jgi:predicted dienelactone hydrolase